MVNTNNQAAIALSHPTGNTFVRALLDSLQQANRLAMFFTTLAIEPDSWYLDLLPGNIGKELLRRNYNVPTNKTYTYPIKELTRMVAAKVGLGSLTEHETGWACIDAVYQDLDREVARVLLASATEQGVYIANQKVGAVYCYEDAALQTFQAAKQTGLICGYDLPIAYWQTVQQLLYEEAERLPQWEPTLIGTSDSQAKLDRKVQELELADVVVCPSQFVYESLPEAARASKKCIVAEFGSPQISPTLLQTRNSQQHSADRPLRLLFAGSMSQRKGLADVFAAMQLLDRSDIELVVLGSPIASMDFYRAQYANFTYEPTRPHAEVLKLMLSCDVLVLPSIVEGRALVQQEAMSCGLPIIVTPNAGGQDLVEPEQTGFLVPMRSPERLAEVFNWFADHRDRLPEMSSAAQAKAAAITWAGYGHKIIEALMT
ncbi:glycosyl transferase group 1 [Thalassoporum mexicanum PCC 7367]|uniref:glycosyltransferase family 4 protein n=1 Tax=Thalassoporum mexicanum TaxID=3457544 RepID=UPI00029F9EDA|nr:glycosyltransferase family 4 protein [Pseudanabaena sp. PCC 7367]AFY69023.1 glycosyl transferase group 1 [Pseudanabaena sp. PCC 7367]